MDLTQPAATKPERNFGALKNFMHQSFVLRKAMLNASIRGKDIVACCAIYPVLHWLVSLWSQPASPEELETTRILSATIQWGGLLLFSSMMAIQTLRWQLEESYASDTLTLIGTRAWIFGNFTALLQITALFFTIHTATLMADATYHGQFADIPIQNWVVYYLNGIATLATALGFSMLWSVWLPKSMSFICVLLILSVWLNILREPFTFVLPPIFLLEAKGLLCKAGSNASFVANPGPWIITLCLACCYTAACLRAIPRRLVYRLLKA
jgi:hypothetical protein